jgi:hypothetical protein
MSSVTVDLADLETLVMTTGALKVIEGAIVQRKNDPFVREHLDFTAAHDRLAASMRNARRAEAGTLVPWDGELDGVEVLLLRDVADMEMGVKAIGCHKEDYTTLMAKGCVIIGQEVNGILWAGEKQPDIRITPGYYSVRITDRGREKLAKIDAVKAARAAVALEFPDAADLCGND